MREEGKELCCWHCHVLPSPLEPLLWELKAPGGTGSVWGPGRLRGLNEFGPTIQPVELLVLMVLPELSLNTTSPRAVPCRDVHVLNTEPENGLGWKGS